METLTLVFLAIIIILIIAIPVREWISYYSFINDIYYNVMKGSRRKKKFRNIDIIVIYDEYKSLPDKDFKIAKLKLRSFAKDNFVQSFVGILLVIITIMVSLISILSSMTKTTVKDIYGIGLLAILIGALLVVYTFHIYFENDKNKILKAHLAAVNEIERERP
ncbi:hypothetical protein [Paenibacillus pinihumi]|uniref:hypothetical protein n=1 Tax=Paenibacillus pinihumi TaxID=669462 RepID=UPI00048F8390|nr:hypothetical protein [Paenibacillus pinihumi]